jgi:hypothetical protein
MIIIDLIIGLIACVLIFIPIAIFIVIADIVINVCSVVKNTWISNNVR